MGAVGWTGTLDELNRAVWASDSFPPEPILITTSRIILAGFGRWQRALLDGKQQINCIEYPFNDDEALQFILDYHQPKRGWNDFVRICLALTRKPALHRKAVENMRAGGKYKGLSNLTKADRINVQAEIARMAGTCRVNVDKVEVILKKAIDSIVAALRSGTLSIHKAWLWCELRSSQQEEAFAIFEEERTRRRICREFSLKGFQQTMQFERVMEELRRAESRRPGSVVIRTSNRRRTEVILGRDLLANPEGDKETSPNV